MGLNKERIKNKIKEKAKSLEGSFKEKAVILLEKNKNPLIRRLSLAFLIKTTGNSEKERVKLMAELMEKLEENNELICACKLFPSLIVYEKALTKIEKNIENGKELSFDSWVDLMRLYLDKFVYLNDKIRDKLIVIGSYLRLKEEYGIIEEETRNSEKRRINVALGGLSLAVLGFSYSIEAYPIFYISIPTLLYSLGSWVIDKIKKLEKEEKIWFIERDLLLINEEAPNSPYFFERPSEN